jgi:hypothetical protein
LWGLAASAVAARMRERRSTRKGRVHCPPGNPRSVFKLDRNKEPAPIEAEDRAPLQLAATRRAAALSPQTCLESIQSQKTPAILRPPSSSARSALLPDPAVPVAGRRLERTRPPSQPSSPSIHPSSNPIHPHPGIKSLLDLPPLPRTQSSADCNPSDRLTPTTHNRVGVGSGGLRAGSSEAAGNGCGRSGTRTCAQL